jgi:hypothetical protein
VFDRRPLLHPDEGEGGGWRSFGRGCFSGGVGFVVCCGIDRKRRVRMVRACKGKGEELTTGADITWMRQNRDGRGEENGEEEWGFL